MDTTWAFCIGAQKAGTSWLHDFLTDHPECHTTTVKELHYFDDLHGPVAYGFTRKRLAGLLDVTERAAQAALDERETDRLRRLARLVSVHGYPDDEGYRALLTHGRREEPVVADVTPAYAVVDRAGFEHMARFGADVRFVFVMRDPVERLWSAVRQGAARGGRLDEDRLERAWRRRTSGEPELRSDYARTIRTLEDVVLTESVLYLFYETLFTPETIARLTSFLGIGPGRPELGRTVRRGVPATMPPAYVAAASAQLAEQYAFVHDRFGDAVPAAWHRP